MSFTAKCAALAKAGAVKRTYHDHVARRARRAQPAQADAPPSHPAIATQSTLSPDWIPTIEVSNSCLGEPAYRIERQPIQETAPDTALRILLLIVLLGIQPAIAPLLCEASPTTIPAPSHVVVVMEENHGYGDIIGSPQAPYINRLALAGASFTHAHAISHPSLPNYLALFCGSTQGVTDDSCPLSFRLPDLQSELLAAKLTFVGYSEDLPAIGSEVCFSGYYARKHVPWAYFPNDPPANNRPFTDFPRNFENLPTVSWVIPNQVNDMHSGPIEQADRWLQRNLSRYVTWAQTNNSLLIIDWDEDNGGLTNHVPTIFVGPMVKSGRYFEKIDHYNVLRTIEDMYGLSHLGHSAAANPIIDVWQ